MTTSKTFASTRERDEFASTAAASAYNLAIGQLKADFGLDSVDLHAAPSARDLSQTTHFLARQLAERCEVVPPGFLVTVERGPTMEELGAAPNNGPTQHIASDREEMANIVSTLVRRAIFADRAGDNDLEISVSEGPDDALGGREGESWWVDVRGSGTKAWSK